MYCQIHQWLVYTDSELCCNQSHAATLYKPSCQFAINAYLNCQYFCYSKKKIASYKNIAMYKGKVIFFLSMPELPVINL